jgi:hypothetical protein
VSLNLNPYRHLISWFLGAEVILPFTLHRFGFNDILGSHSSEYEDDFLMGCFV